MGVDIDVDVEKDTLTEIWQSGKGRWVATGPGRSTFSNVWIGRLDEVSTATIPQNLHLRTLDARDSVKIHFTGMSKLALGPGAIDPKLIGEPIVTTRLQSCLKLGPLMELPVALVPTESAVLTAWSVLGECESDADVQGPEEMYSALFAAQTLFGELETAFFEPREVHRFLLKHPFLIHIVSNSITYVREIFGEDTPIELEVVKDPEGMDEEMLFAYISVTGSPSEAMELMDKLDDEFYLAQSPQVQELFNFNVRFT